MTYGTWTSSTHIRHATSALPDGPWTSREVAVPPAAGNPVLTRAPDGTFLMYFTNQRWEGQQRNCSGPQASWGAPAYCTSHCENGISLASSQSLNGPWNITYNIVKFGATNPGTSHCTPCPCSRRRRLTIAV